MRCELAGGGQLLTPLKPTREDALGDHLLDLLLQGALRIGAQEKGFDGQGHGAKVRLALGGVQSGITACRIYFGALPALPFTLHLA